MTIITTLGPASAFASPDRLDPPGAGRIALGLERLGVVGTALYVAAHPDDENTRLLAWLANARGLRAVYLSLTRGDGGQNLVGPELGHKLGVIRTHELLAARAVDGAEQRFTRAVDFGYSKSADETLRVWGREAVLADVVGVIREVRPDVIFSRFSTKPPNHGHHTASALLAYEAFTAAADGARFADRGPAYAPLRIFENKSSWRFKKGQDLSGYLTIDVGGFSPLLGRSYTELAATSRTMHKSQGFGSAPTYGALLEYFEPAIRDQWPSGARPLPPNNLDPLADLDFSWARFSGTETLRAHIAEAREAFSPAHPELLLPHLAKVRDALTRLPDDNPYKRYKMAEVDELIVACAGLVLDARADSPNAIPGEPLAVTASATLRLPASVDVSIAFPDGSRRDLHTLRFNERYERKHTFTVDAPLSSPYWLSGDATAGLFAPRSPLDGTVPVGPPALTARFSIEVAGTSIETRVPVRHVWVDRVHGERWRPVEIVPPVTVTPVAPVRMFTGKSSRPIDVRVRAHGAARKGQVHLLAPSGWKVAPSVQDFALEPEAEAIVRFEVSPTGSAPATLRFEARTRGLVSDRAEAVIDHLHIPATTMLSRSSMRAVPLEITIGAKRIGYITGAGDDVPTGLEQVGYQVTRLEVASLEHEDLSRFDALIAGIRAHNVAPELRHHHDKLMRYVASGGTYLVQYLTSSSWRPLEVPVGPYPFRISRGRVTDQTAPLRPIDAAHPALTTPNRLDDADFAGWVQERGLYFADHWDAQYKPLFVCNDPGESPLEGSVLIARHGKGVFVYTGLSFFRQLPAGVAGAYRLLANLLALEGHGS